MRRRFIYIIGTFAVIAIAGVAYTRSRHAPSGASSSLFGASAPQAAAAIVHHVDMGPRPIPADCGQQHGETCTEYRVGAPFYFSVFYPNTFTEKTYDEGDGASTFVFQNVKDARGFQIFAVPYGGDKITQYRFQKDEPSGVRDDLQNAVIDNVPAATFYGQDARLGDTYEIWFIQDGYLFEVTTLKPLDTWLQSVMRTWMFM